MDIYYRRDDYELCGQVLDILEKVLSHCIRHSYAPSPAYDLITFCEKSEFSMFTKRYNLNSKLGRHEDNIPIFRKLFEFESTHNMPLHQKININTWEQVATLYNITSRKKLNCKSIDGLSNKMLLKVFLHAKETERNFRLTKPVEMQEIDANARTRVANDFGVSVEKLDEVFEGKDVRLLSCGHCDKQEASLGEFKKCVCKKVVYCGVACQRQHWKKHKKVCMTKK